MSASSTFVVFLQQKNKKKLEGVKLQPQRGAGLTYSQAAKQIATKKSLHIDEVELSDPVTGAILTATDQQLLPSATVLFRRCQYAAKPAEPNPTGRPLPPPSVSVPLARGGQPAPPCQANHAPAYPDKSRPAGPNAHRLLAAPPEYPAAADPGLVAALRVLGLRPGAGVHDIKTAYHSLAKAHHPDKSAAPDAATTFRSIHTAYSMLVECSFGLPHAAAQSMPAQQRPTAVVTPPPEILCTVCNRFMRDAVIVRCCYTSFCAECCRQISCPSCAQPTAHFDAPLANRNLQAAVKSFTAAHPECTAAHHHSPPADAPDFPIVVAQPSPNNPSSAGRRHAGHHSGGIKKRRGGGGAWGAGRQSGGGLGWRCVSCWYENQPWRPHCRKCTCARMY